jgi:hypothetical protein
LFDSAVPAYLSPRRCQVRSQVVRQRVRVDLIEQGHRSFPKPTQDVAAEQRCLTAIADADHADLEGGSRMVHSDGPMLALSALESHPQGRNQSARG